MVDTWARPQAGRMAIEVSSDGSIKDSRRLDLAYDEITFVRLPVTYQPGTLEPIQYRRFNLAGQRGRQLRFVTPSLHDVEVFAGETRPAVPKFAVVYDADGDGNDEVAVGTEANEIVVIATDGRAKWRQALDAPISQMAAIDVDCDGQKELVVGTMNFQIMVFGPDGALRHTSTRAAGAPTGAYAIAPLAGRTPRETALALGGYGRVHVATLADRPTSSHGIGGCACDLVATKGLDVNDDGLDDIVARCKWGGVKALDAVTREVLWQGGCYWNRGLGLLRWPDDPPDLVRALMVTRGGLQMYALRGDGEPTGQEWRLPFGDMLSSYAVADVDGDGSSEIVVGRLDGFLFVVGGNGHLEQTHFIGRPIRDLATLRAGPVVRIALATNRDVRILCGPDLSQVAAWNDEVRFLCVATHGDTEQLVCLGDGFAKSAAQ